MMVKLCIDGEPPLTPSSPSGRLAPMPRFAWGAAAAPNQLATNAHDIERPHMWGSQNCTRKCSMSPWIPSPTAKHNVTSVMCFPAFCQRSDWLSAVPLSFRKLLQCHPATLRKLWFGSGLPNMVAKPSLAPTSGFGPLKPGCLGCSLASPPA